MIVVSLIIIILILSTSAYLYYNKQKRLNDSSYEGQLPNSDEIVNNTDNSTEEKELSSEEIDELINKRIQFKEIKFPKLKSCKRKAKNGKCNKGFTMKKNGQGHECCYVKGVKPMGKMGMLKSMGPGMIKDAVLGKIGSMALGGGFGMLTAGLDMWDPSGYNKFVPLSENVASRNMIEN